VSFQSDVVSTPSLLALLEQWTERDPNSEFITSYDIHTSRKQGALAQRASRTVRQIREDVISLAVSLRRLGLRRDDVVAVQLPNWHEWIVTHLALYAIGVVTMPISPVFRTRDVGQQLSVADVRAFVIPSLFGSFDYLAMAAEMQAHNNSLQNVIAVGPVIDDRPVLWWDQLVSDGASAPTELRAGIAAGDYAHGIDDVMLLNFTSGTTGEPKGVTHTTGTITVPVAAAAERLELSASDIVFVAVTLGHGGGFLNGMYLPLLLGTRLVLMDMWDAGFALQVIERERITYGPTMPPYLMDLIEHPAFASTDISSWRVARVSGGAIPRHVIASLHQKIPTIRLCPGWGMSELTYVTCGSPRDPISKLNDTDGKPLDVCQIEIRDETFNHILPIGQPGEIVVRSPGCTPGYYGRDELTHDSKTSDGWFKSGDVGQIDADGYLNIVGRNKDIIVRGAENVPVVEVEQLISEHPAVVAVALIGVPDKRLGERVCAVIEFVPGAEPLTLDDMRAYLTGCELTRQFIPEYLVPIARLPRTTTGKIRKSIVRDYIEAQFSTSLSNLGRPSAEETERIYD